MKGITPVISIIILLLVAIAMDGSAYTFIFGYQGAFTAKSIKIVEGSAKNNEIVISNIGTASIDTAEYVKIEINGKPATILNHKIIQPNTASLIRFASPEFGENLDVRIIGPANVLNYKINIEGCIPGETRSCSVVHLGICAQGTETCSASQVWGGCPSPTEESIQAGTCTDSLDNDCDGRVDAADSDCGSVTCSNHGDEPTCEGDSNCDWCSNSGSCISTPEQCDGSQCNGVSQYCSNSCTWSVCSSNTYCSAGSCVSCPQNNPNTKCCSDIGGTWDSNGFCIEDGYCDSANGETSGNSPSDCVIPGDWLPDYSYRKKINIAGQTGAGTEYIIKFAIGSLSTLFKMDFHLEDNSINFPHDIRFTDDDGTTELNYWIYDITDDPVTVWVKVNDDLSSDQSIYIYYGNSDASTTTSNGYNTFIFFDDFEDDNIGDPPDPTKFLTFGTTATDTVDIQQDPYNPSNKLLKTFESIDSISTGFVTVGLPAADYAFGYKYRFDGAYRVYYIVFFEDSTLVITVVQGEYNAWDDLRFKYYNGYSYVHFVPVAHDMWDFVWYDVEHMIYDNTYEVLVNDILSVGGTRSTINSGVTSIRCNPHRRSIPETLTQYHDDFFVRRYIDPEPSISSVENEEMLP